MTESATGTEQLFGRGACGTTKGRLLQKRDRFGQTVNLTVAAMDASDGADGHLDTQTLPGKDVTTYAYDPLGELTSATNASVTEAFGYNAGGQLTSETTKPTGSSSYPQAVLTYTYDPNGNRLTMTGQPTPTSALTTYDWNAAHQLLAIHLPNGTTTSYRYDPFGRRIEIDASGQITRYVYDAENTAYEYDGSNNVVASYTNGLGEDSPLEMGRGGAAYYYLKDGSGSTTALTDSAGALVATYTYDTYGNQTSAGGITNPFTYTGREYDPTSGLYYFRSRYYDPTTGRFLSEDPLLSLNPYAYANNSPTNFTDPSGQLAVETAFLLLSPRLSFVSHLQAVTACVAGQLLKIAAIMQDPAVQHSQTQLRPSVKSMKRWKRFATATRRRGMSSTRSVGKRGGALT